MKDVLSTYLESNWVISERTLRTTMEVPFSVKENEICNGLQNSVIIGILETFIQEFEYEMWQFRQDLDFKNGHVNSLAGKLNCLTLESET